MTKYFNVSLSRDMIAQAYHDNESRNSYCFIVGPISNNLPSGFEIVDTYIENGNLKIEYVNNTPYEVYYYIDGGELYVRFMKGGQVMALVDLGNVIGPQGPTGAQGPQGPAGSAATIQVGTVTTGAAGSNASVTNVGTTSAAKFNFTIPRGNTGATGPQGDAGISPTFVLGDGTGGTINGHLYADYDNPYTP